MLKLVPILPALLFFAFLPKPSAPAPAQATPPTDPAQLVNPETPTPESQARAKDIYGFDCAMCHGATGNGKGDLVGPMKLTNLKDFTDPATLKDVSDGQLFTIISNGKGQMPAEGGRAKPEEVWNLVIYLRSLSKK
jgi:mono/diheme cytochrome c family protein